jgi:hypothetical protein
MSYLDRMSPFRGRKAHAVFSEVGGLAVYGGASYGFGYLQNRYRERASVAGVPADLAAGAGLSAISLIGDLLGWHGGMMAFTRDVGRAGVGSFMHTLGAGHGGGASGMTRVLVHSKDVAKVRAALPNATILGEISKAPPGALLSTGELLDLARG